jgi:beta-N-acetylhexosaminidase
LPTEQNLLTIGLGEETANKVTRNAATLISPKIDQLAITLPDEPAKNDRIIIFTDTLSIPQCADCIPQDIVSVNELQNDITRLYGKIGSGQIQQGNIISYPFFELQDFVQNPFNRLELESNLSRANWVLFVIDSQNSNRDGSSALHNLLTTNPGALRNKNVVVFSFSAPYYYDATEISAFTAYYCLYTKIPAAFETAAKLLFKEITPTGESPVSISGIAYNLINATSPKSDQVIELIVEEPPLSNEGTLTPEPTSGEVSGFKSGDNLPIKTGVILDNNGHPVPDGTVVKFMLSEQGENLTIQQLESTTKEGIAKASFKLQASGRQEIRATSEPAMNSQILIIDISQGSEAIISSIIPTPVPTIIPFEQTPTLEAIKETSTLAKPIKNNRFTEWLLISIISWLSGYGFYTIATFIKYSKARAYISTAIIIGGLASGIWIMAGLPGSFLRNGFTGYLFLISIVLAGSMIAGLIIWFIEIQRGHLKVK